MKIRPFIWHDAAKVCPPISTPMEIQPLLVIRAGHTDWDVGYFSAFTGGWPDGRWHIMHSPSAWEVTHWMTVAMPGAKKAATHRHIKTSHPAWSSTKFTCVCGFETASDSTWRLHLLHKRLTNG